MYFLQYTPTSTHYDIIRDSHKGRPERDNVFIWLQKIRKFILNEVATSARSKGYGREDSIRSSFDFIHKI